HHVWALGLARPLHTTGAAGSGAGHRTCRPGVAPGYSQRQSPSPGSPPRGRPQGAGESLHTSPADGSSRYGPAPAATPAHGVWPGGWGCQSSPGLRTDTVALLRAVPDGGRTGQAPADGGAVAGEIGDAQASWARPRARGAVHSDKSHAHCQTPATVRRSLTSG